MPEPFTPAELEAGAEASWANAWDGVPPDLQPSSPPWQEFAAANQENADYFRRKAAHVLRAVLPDHDARVRAEERARVAEEITDWAGYGYSTDWEQGYRAAMHAAEIARGTEEEHHAEPVD